MAEPWKSLSREIAFQSKWYKVYKETVLLPSGVMLDDYFISELPNSVLIFAVTATDEVVLVQQYRHGVKQVLLEVPSGTFDAAREKPEDAARRELLEETGYAAEELISLGQLYEYPTKESHTCYPFLAKNVVRVAAQQLDVGEIIEIVEVPLSSIQQQIAGGAIQVAVSIATIFRGLEKLPEIGQR